jgi:hypothetical protein
MKFSQHIYIGWKRFDDTFKRQTVYFIFADCTSPFEIYVTSDAKPNNASITAISRGEFSVLLTNSPYIEGISDSSYRIHIS